MEKVLTTQGLEIGYQGKALISGINVTLEKGKVTTLIGRNGTGKSTLIKTLTGSLAPVGGAVRIFGKNLREISKKEMARSLALVTTDPHMAGGLRLEELVGLGRIPHTGLLGHHSATDREKIDNAIEAVGLQHKRKEFVSRLSDGERQKGMIAKGLAQDTPIILMDEPFTYLDVGARLEMLALITRLAHERDKAVLFSTHEVTQALRMADRVWLATEKSDGRMGEMKEGTPREIIESGEIEKLFPSPNIRFDKNTFDFYYAD